MENGGVGEGELLKPAVGGGLGHRRADYGAEP